MTVPKRHYDTERVRAELAGSTQYGGRACRMNPDHVREDGTTLRDTVKYRCLLCRRVQRTARNDRRRAQSGAGG